MSTSKRLKIIRATTVPMSLNAFCCGMLKELSGMYDVVALSSPGEELNEVAEREGINVIAVPMERHISLWRDLKALICIIGVFRREKPAMVHSMTPKAGLLCMIAGWLTKVPVRVHTFTGLVWPTEIGLKRKILMATDWLTCACATHVIPEGEGVKNDLVKGKITKKTLKVLGYGNVRGVDMEYYSQARVGDSLLKSDLLAKKGNSFTFLFVGRIVRDKGINELCQAFVKFHESHPDSRLWLVGRFEDELDPVSEDTRTLIENKKSGIEAVGEKRGEELLVYYAVADCFVMPSYREGFPNTVIEAGAMGLPSIVTDINGSREIITDGENGLIVPPRDEEHLFNAMQLMMQSNDDRVRMAGAARKMIADRFEQGFVRKCLYDYYDEILKSSPRLEQDILVRK